MRKNWITVNEGQKSTHIDREKVRERENERETKIVREGERKEEENGKEGLE